MNFSDNNDNNNSTRLKFPPFLQCTRTGNSDWRCQSMVAPGRSYCLRHYHEQKIRNIRKRDKKLARLGYRSNSSSSRMKAFNNISRITHNNEVEVEDVAGIQNEVGKRKRSGVRSDDYYYDDCIVGVDEDDGDESDEDVSESEFFMKRIVMRGCDSDEKEIIVKKIKTPSTSRDFCHPVDNFGPQFFAGYLHGRLSML